jgi:hypothetical protein
MRVILADVKSSRGFVSKDTVVGGYGSRLNPFSRVTAIMAWLKQQFHDVPSVHMAYMAAILARAGHEVKWTRGDQMDGDVALVLSSLVDHRNETAWADSMRARGVKVGFVGITASKMPHLFQDHCDFILNGEPEAAVMRLAQGDIPHVIVVSEQINDLDSLPFPRWDLVTDQRRKMGIQWSARPVGGGFPLLASRGCPEFCTYCPHRILAGYRARSIANILDEMERLCDQYRHPYVIFRDPLFTEQRERLLQLCDGIQARGLELTFEAETRLDRLDVDLLDRHQARDLLLLAACYDQSTAETSTGRWHRLRQRLKFQTWQSYWQLALGCGVSLLLLWLVMAIVIRGGQAYLRPWWIFPLLAAGWGPWLWKAWKDFWHARSILARMRVGIHETMPLCQLLMHFTPAELSGQPLPNKDSTDDRYELLLKLQGLLQTLGHTGIIVLVDRLDEPHLVNGSPELMKALLWPMLDNKFLKHPGLGLKLMLPIELTRFIEREERDFYQRARLDKQNMIPSFEWTGEGLFDVANARLIACAKPGLRPALTDLFDPAIGRSRMIEAFRALRVPRRLFKFLYHLIASHCNAHTDQDPSWQISATLFESTLALSLRDQDAFDRGVGAG